MCQKVREGHVRAQPLVFNAEVDTQVPALQAWCHSIGSPSWTTILDAHLADLSLVRSSIQTYTATFDGPGVEDLLAVFLELCDVEVHVRKMRKNLEKPVHA